MFKSVARLLVPVCLLALAVGCAHTPKKDKDKDADKPLVLKPIKQTVAVQRVWHVSLRGQLPKLRLGLAPAVEADRVYLASAKGVVRAYALANGKELWSRKLKTQLGGGPGANAKMVVVGGTGGELIALAAADGAVLWRVRLGGEILAAPTVTDEVIIARTVDGRMHALEPGDGRARWVADQQPPKLSLRGQSAAVIVGDTVYAGFDNGRLMAVLLSNGTTVWDVAVAQARGSTELQRLVDIDAPVIIDGDELYAASYQGKLERLSRDNAQLSWSRELSSYRGLALDATTVYLSTAEGEVVALDRVTGVERWRQSALLRRQLSGPVLDHGRIVVGDYQGVLHWLNPADGSFVARYKISHMFSRAARIDATPVEAGDMLLAFTDKGELGAFRTAGP
jgi:outer membrane protein assembly factor BamB